MSSMYCDRCGQVDQSIAISALRSLDSGPQFSQSVGGIIHDGDYTPVMSTSMSRDTGLLNLQVAAGKFASLEGLLQEKGIVKKPAEVVMTSGFWKAMAPMILGISSLIIGMAAKPFGTFNENAMFGLFMAGVCLVGFIFSFRNIAKQAKLSQQRIQGVVTPEMRALVARRERGSYCKRCNSFSPEHV